MTEYRKTLKLIMWLCLMMIAEAASAVPKTTWQLFVWMKNGEKTGFLFAEKPEFRLDGEVVKFRAEGTSMDIPKAELDKFTVEQVLPTDPTAITMPATMTVGYRRTAMLKYTLMPDDALTTITWLNDATGVVSIATDGLLTGLQPGTALVKVQTHNGLKASCEVTVPVPRYRLVVWKSDGRKDAQFNFDEKPEITIDGKTFTVATEKKSVSYLAGDIGKFTLDDSGLIKTGDTNGDGAVDVADIAFIISVMAGGTDVTEAIRQDADVNGDHAVDVADIATVIDEMARN